MAKKKKKAAAKGKGRGRKASNASKRTAAILFFGVLGFALIAALLIFLNLPLKEVPVQVNVMMKLGKGHGAGPGQLDSPRGIATGPDGRIYVTDLGNSRISVFNSDGTFAFSFGKKGDEPPKSLPGDFNEPSGVAVSPDNKIYVADAWNGRIQSFDAKGKPLGEFGGPRYGFYSPRNVAVDGQGNVYVADTGNSKVKVYDPNGKELGEVGTKADKANGSFNEVFGLAIDNKGDLYAADAGNRRVEKFSPLPNLAFLKAAKVPGWAAASGPPFWPHLACDKDGNVYAMDNTQHKIWVFDGDLKYRGTLGGPSNDFMGSPLGLAFDPQGDLYVGDMGPNQILKLSQFMVPAAK